MPFGVEYNRQRSAKFGHSIFSRQPLYNPFAMTKNPSDEYIAPQSLAELLQRYAAGERSFPDTELDDTDFSNVVLNGASFGPFSGSLTRILMGQSSKG